MDYTYQVPREAYIELLADMIRRNERRPIRVFTFLLLTVVQLAVVLLLCLFRLEAGQRIFVLIWSLLLAALTVLRRSTVIPRAKGTLQRLEYTGQLPEEYWKEHRLRTVGQELRLNYGPHKLACPLYAISQVEERPHALHLYCGGTIFDIMPETAFHSHEAMLRFAKTLRAMAADAEVPPRSDGEASGDLSWTMSEKDFEQGQSLAFRTLYYRHRFLRPATFVRLTISVLAVINLANNTAPVNVALSIVVLLLANLENISMIPPLCRLRIRREVGHWRGGSAYRLSWEEGALHYTSDRAEVRIPTGRINLCEQIGPYFVIAWNNFPAVVLPLAVYHTPEATALTGEIKAVFQGK